MITRIGLYSPQSVNFDNRVATGNFSARSTGMSYGAEAAKIPLSALQAYALPFMGAQRAFTQEFRLPGGASFNGIFEQMTPQMRSVIEDFNERSSKDEQFLKWVELPANQLKKDAEGKSHVDEIYAQAFEMKNRKSGESPRPIVVAGIGGSKHTAEFLLNLNGAGNKGKVYFYSDIDPVSYNNFLEETGKDILDLNFLIVSKSGTTFETKDAYKRLEKGVVEAYKKEGLSLKEARQKAQEHFAFATDKTAKAGNLRETVGDENGEGNKYIKELYVHDDVGGRYSMFDDPGIFAAAYAGVPKEDMEKILKSAAAVSKKMTNADKIGENTAAKAAMFNVYSRSQDYNITMQQLFGHLFEGGGENWFKQLYLESEKDFNFMVGKSPDSMHYATEGHFNPNNREVYNTIMTIQSPKISRNYEKYTSALADTYNETTPLMIETLDTIGNKIKPEAIGRYIQSKHFETVYMGMLRREMEGGETIPKDEALPEVLQPSVEVYKKKFKPGSPFELTPGGK